MGLLDKLLGKKEIVLTKQGAYILSAMTLYDCILEEINEDFDTSYNDDIDALDDAHEVFYQNSIDECIDIVTNIIQDDEDKKIVITELLDSAIYLDCIIEDDVKDLLEKYIEAFNIDSSYVETAINILSIRAKEFID